MLQSAMAMKVALPFWNGRISPVFDVAKNLRVLEIEHGTVTQTHNVRIEDGGRVARLEELDVDTLVCAAISRPLEAACWVAGVEVVSDVSGRLDEVIEALLNGNLEGTRATGRGFAREVDVSARRRDTHSDAGTRTRHP
jgi:predicted Fe-Mo cluster-binding NifX family protein